MVTNPIPSHEQIMLKIMNCTKTSDECCLWTESLYKGSPHFYNIHIKNYLWGLSHPKVERGHHLENTCRHERCINTEHLKIIDRSIDWDQVWERLLNKSKMDGECIIWTGKVDKGGYGHTNIKGKTYSVHRISYMIKNGGEEIPTHVKEKRVMIRHICPKGHNPSCINPNHLILGTYSENANDRKDNGTHMEGGTHPQSKITEEVAQKIKLSLFKKGETGYRTRQVRADFFGVPLSTVSSIDVGQAWAHLKDKDGNDFLHNRDRININIRENRKRKKGQAITLEEFEKAGEVLYSRTKKTSENKKGDIQGECWEYNHGKLAQNGYAYACLYGRNKLAHIWSRSIYEKREKLQHEVTRHLCGNRSCINPEHLAFGTNSENSNDAFLHGSKGAKLTVDDVRDIRSSKMSTNELAKKYNVHFRSIYCVLTRRTWKLV